MGIPLLGCASHRLNLAVRLLTATHEEHLNQVQQLMIKLTTLNQAAALRFKTPLRHVLRHDTRWGSTFGMLRRYFELLEFVDRNDDFLAEEIPSAAANRQLRSLLENLKMVESVSKRIQTVTVSVWDVRRLFDDLIGLFPVFEQYLGPNAAIVENPAFEAALVKIQGGRGHLLNRAEKVTMRHMTIEPATSAASDDELGYAERVLKRARVADQASKYILAEAATPTSNVAERLLGMARATIGLDRNPIQPITLEAILFLKANRSFWNVELVHECLERASA